MTRLPALVLGLTIAAPAVRAAPAIAHTTLYVHRTPDRVAFRKAQAALEGFKRVQLVAADYAARRLTVTHEGRLKTALLIDALRRGGYGPSLAPPAHGPFVPRKIDTRGLDIKTVSKDGREVALRSHLARGKVTIFDFSADWCKPCMLLEEKLADLCRREKRVAVRKIDVTQWDTPVVRQHLRGIKGLPYVEVFGRDGQKVTSLQIPQIWKIEDIIRPHLR